MEGKKTFGNKKIDNQMIETLLRLSYWKEAFGLC